MKDILTDTAALTPAEEMDNTEQHAAQDTDASAGDENTSSESTDSYAKSEHTIDTYGDIEGDAEDDDDAKNSTRHGADTLSEGKIPDYEALMRSDVEALKAQFPELSGINDVTDLNNPLRYATLRDLGLTPEEAYLATAKRVGVDTRSHLRSAHGRNASTSQSAMSQHELAAARELFPGKSDRELQNLYKRVSK